MQQLQEKVRRLAMLEQQCMDWESECKQLKKDIFDLRIKANNEQVDVDRLEGFSLKNVLLTIQGRKDEQLEQERREARHAKASYDQANARLAAIELQLQRVQEEISTLCGCEEELAARTECQTEQFVALGLLQQVRQTMLSAKEEGKKLIYDLDQLASWIGGNKSIYVRMEQRNAEMTVQTQLQIYQNRLRQLKEQLPGANLALDTSTWQFYERDYIDSFLIGAMNRCLEIQEQTRQVLFQLEGALKTLDQLLREKRIEWMNSMV